jgi:hypothetical protein
MSDLLQEALNAKQSGDIALAKQLISQALVQQPTNEAAWMMMADVVEDVSLRRNCLERVLAINPKNSEASTALTRLNTSPLSPVSRGERDTPITPPTVEKVPPFTPPFTWESEQEQFLALGDMTYPDLSGTPSTTPVDATPTFDWAHESDEPDKTIQKIFDAVSNPELASQPLPNTDVDWLEEHPAGEEAAFAANGMGSQEEQEARMLDELVGPDEPTLPEELPVAAEDFSVSPEPQLGLDAFISPDENLAPLTSDYRLWDNPAARVDRMVLVNNQELIYANPRESDVPHILGLFAENKLLYDLLGKNPGTIKLEDIRRLTAIPTSSRLTVEFAGNGKKLSIHELTFSSPQVRDEVIESLQLRLGVAFTRTSQTFSMADKLIPPLVTMLFIAFLGWGLIAGIPLLAGMASTLPPFIQDFINMIQSFVDFVGPFYVLLVAVLGVLLALIWLLNNLRQPSRLVIVGRQIPKA